MHWQIILRRSIRTFIFIFCVWALIFTNYGLVDYIKCKSEITRLEKELEILEKEKEQLLKNVKSLSKEEIDLDMLEVQVRKILAYARKGEAVYFWK